MAMPATTGQLRTKISDMEVGDYIAAEFNVGGTNDVGEIGTVTSAELPYDLTANTQSGSFYFVKADKGLLIADRVVQVLRTYTELHTRKHIQGKQWNPASIIPIMTGNTSPSGEVSASTNNSNGLPVNAFNGKTASYADRWYVPSLGTMQWIQYKFPEAKVVKSYIIAPVTGDGSAGPLRAPKNFTFSGSNDGVNFVELDNQTNITVWGDETYRAFNIQNETPYLYYRLTVTATVSAVELEIGELKMFDYPVKAKLRSLGGGVAHRDANGNKSLTATDLGAWPTNNEWDKYIVDFPPHLIQAGKTLDDVFHWYNAYTWCQEAPIVGMLNRDGTTSSTNLFRMTRGRENSMVQAVMGKANTTSDAMTGFRPVLEYKE